MSKDFTTLKYALGIEASNLNQAAEPTEITKRFNEFLISVFNNDFASGLVKSLEWLNFSDKKKDLIMTIFKVDPSYDLESLKGLDESQIVEEYLKLTGSVLDYVGDKPRLTFGEDFKGKKLPFLPQYLIDQSLILKLDCEWLESLDGLPADIYKIEICTGNFSGRQQNLPSNLKVLKVGMFINVEGLDLSNCILIGQNYLFRFDDSTVFHEDYFIRSFEDKRSLFGPNLWYSRDLINLDLSNANLSKCYFSKLEDCDLSNANLQKSDLLRADVTRLNLTGANLEGAVIDIKYKKYLRGLGFDVTLIDFREFWRPNFDRFTHPYRVTDLRKKPPVRAHESFEPIRTSISIPGQPKSNTSSGLYPGVIDLGPDVISTSTYNFDFEERLGPVDYFSGQISPNIKPPIELDSEFFEKLEAFIKSKKD